MDFALVWRRDLANRGTMFDVDGLDYVAAHVLAYDPAATRVRPAVYVLFLHGGLPPTLGCCERPKFLAVRLGRSGGSRLGSRSMATQKLSAPSPTASTGPAGSLSRRLRSRAAQDSLDRR